MCSKNPSFCEEEEKEDDDDDDDDEEGCCCVTSQFGDEFEFGNFVVMV